MVFSWNRAVAVKSWILLNGPSPAQGLLLGAGLLFAVLGVSGWPAAWAPDVRENAENSASSPPASRGPDRAPVLSSPHLSCPIHLLFILCLIPWGVSCT